MVSKNDVVLIDRYKKSAGIYGSERLESVLVNHVTDKTVAFTRYDFLDNYLYSSTDIVSRDDFSQKVVEKIGRVEQKQFLFWTFRQFVGEICN
jgi:hypothetical protein